jgi:hypothetical protein
MGHPPRPRTALRGSALIGASLLALASFGAGTACGTDPVAYEGCRKIESARCRSAPGCPNLKVPDVAACERFYRDHCLHGMALADDPGAPRIDACVGAIERAGTCVKSGDTTCSDVVSVDGATACEMLERPERAKLCEFLVPVPVVPPVDAGTDAPADAATD